jgi:hypothetical protein
VASKKEIDWERVELDYRAGVLSVREIAAAHGVSHTAIGKRAGKEGWTRDLEARIRAKADALVAKREVAKEVATEKAETERQLVDANAEVIANVRLTHRVDIRRFRELALSLMREIEAETGGIELFEELGELLRSEDKAGQDKRNDLYRKVISSGGRIDSMKKLAETLKILIGLEREAYGLANAGEGGMPAGNKEQLLREIAAALPN